MAVVEPVSTPPGAPRRLSLKSPVDLRPLGEIEVTSAEGVQAALERARKVQPAWAALDVEERARVLYRALEIVIRRQDELIDIVIAETGKTRNEAIQIEIFAACDAISYYAKRGVAYSGARKAWPPRDHALPEEAPDPLSAPRRRRCD